MYPNPWKFPIVLTSPHPSTLGTNEHIRLAVCPEWAAIDDSSADRMPCIDEQALSRLTNFEGREVSKRYVDLSPLSSHFKAPGRSPTAPTHQMLPTPEAKDVVHELEAP